MSDSVFSMTVPNEEEIKRELEEQMAPVSEEIQALKAQADNNALAIMTGDITSLESRQAFISSMDKFGADTMNRCSKKNSLMGVSVGNLAKSGSEGGQVSTDLMSLQKELKGLDPSALDFTKRGFLGKIFNPVRDYFARYEKADSVIGDIIVSLDKGKGTLKSDNVTLAGEEDSLRTLTHQLTKEITMGTLMDESISAQVEKAKAEGMDPDRIRFVEEEILFPLRQKVMDMQQLVVVNHQGVIAMEVIQRNNRELIRGVDRAKNVTVTALRTGVMVASALYNQKVVLQKIQALNATTNNIIASTSRMLKEQGAEIQRQSMESTISPDVLRTAFQDCLDALEDISRYKAEALPKMLNTINDFKEMAEEGEKRISRLEQGSRLAISE